MNLPQSLNPGNEQAQFWGSAAAVQNGNYNYAGIRNPVIDEVISKLVTAKTVNSKSLILMFLTDCFVQDITRSRLMERGLLVCVLEYVSAA